MRTITTNIYNNKEIYEISKTNKEVRENLEKRFIEHKNFSFELDCYEIKNTIEKVAQMFNCSIGRYEIPALSDSGYSKAYMFLDTEGYNDLTNWDKNKAIKELQESDLEGCSLTGVCYDVYVLDYIKTLEGGKVTFNNATKFLHEFPSYIFNQVLKDELEYVLSEEGLAEFITEFSYDTEYNADGTEYE